MKSSNRLNLVPCVSQHNGRVMVGSKGSRRCNQTVHVKLVETLSGYNICLLDLLCVNLETNHQENRLLVKCHEGVLQSLCSFSPFVRKLACGIVCAMYLLVCSECT